MGHCVKLSPAKITTPILSVVLLFTKSAATAFAASSRLGFKSCAVILPLTSIHKIMSTPSPSVCCKSFLVCGFAKAIIIQLNASNLIINGKWRKEVFADDNPFAPASEIITDPCCLLFFILYQKIKNNSSANSAKNQGWAKVKLSK